MYHNARTPAAFYRDSMPTHECISFSARLSTALQSQKAVTAYLKSKQLLPFDFAWQNTLTHTLTGWDSTSIQMWRFIVHWPEWEWVFLNARQFWGQLGANVHTHIPRVHWVTHVPKVNISNRPGAGFEIYSSAGKSLEGIYIDDREIQFFIHQVAIA